MWGVGIRYFTYTSRAREDLRYESTSVVGMYCIYVGFGLCTLEYDCYSVYDPKVIINRKW